MKLLTRWHQRRCAADKHVFRKAPPLVIKQMDPQVRLKYIEHCTVWKCKHCSANYIMSKIINPRE
jgi:hypothetical protein